MSGGKREDGLSASGGEKDVKVLATSDIYLDFIRPTALHVSRAGEMRFASEEKDRPAGKTRGRGRCK